MHTYLHKQQLKLLFLPCPTFILWSGFHILQAFSLQVKQTKAGHLEFSKLDSFGIPGCVSGGKRDEDSVCGASNSLKMCHISGIFRM